MPFTSNGTKSELVAEYKNAIESYWTTHFQQNLLVSSRIRYPDEIVDPYVQGAS